MEMVEMENTKSEVKYILDRLDNTLGMTPERVGELGD